MFFLLPSSLSGLLCALSKIPSPYFCRLFAGSPGRPGRNTVRLAILTFACLWLMTAIPAHAAGTTYYINNQAGSHCSDGGAHTLAEPFCSFSPINRIRTFTPGDQILLARGASWDQEMSLTGRGTANEPIVLGAYGTGPNPKILRNQETSDICILLIDASYWNISNLEVGRASVGILLHYTQPFNNGVNISNIYAHDNKGIWGSHSTEYPVSSKVMDPFASGLNINLSSGILFNLASYLTFSSSQYVLKGVTVNNVQGANNVDSVAFDAETNTIENQDGHNAFQDVLLNGLVLASDNGHAARIYQRAGLGCSDSLRLLGMTNVTLMNSVLFDEAGCHTPTGTAALILGRVSNVRVVNNIFFGVPASGSPDETAIDFEWSEDQVFLQGNFFAGNAGAGVEILNIHPGDHTTIDFSGNTFAQNALSHRPGAASIWEDSKGRGYGTPSGSIRNNLYFEQHGRFLNGKDLRLIAQLNQLQTTTVANYAAELFSTSQGRYQWHYMYESADSTWKDMPGYSIAVENGAWQANDHQYVSAFNMVPGACTGRCSMGGVARAWVAPHAGVISIRGALLKADGSSGLSVNAVVNQVSGRNVTQLWPGPRGKRMLSASSPLGYETDVDGIQVNEGDVIRFEVHGNSDKASDVVSWTPSIGYTERRF